MTLLFIIFIDLLHGTNFSTSFISSLHSKTLLLVPILTIILGLLFFIPVTLTHTSSEVSFSIKTCKIIYIFNEISFEYTYLRNMILLLF